MSWGPFGSILVVAAMAGMGGGIERPVFKPLPRAFMTDGEPVRLSVWITPHPDLVSVLVEAWELREDLDFPELTGEKTLIRSSVEETNTDKRLYFFNWQPLPVGTYHLLAKVATGRGIVVSSIPHRLEVR